MQIYNRVMALDYHQNFVSAQYLDNELMELDQFSYALMLTRSTLALLLVNFPESIAWLWPLVVVKILFLLNIL